MDLSPNDALIVVDIQNDFCEGGAVPVKGTEALAGSLSALARRVQAANVRIIATQDWHTENHVTFSNDPDGGKWPSHCVQGTVGAAFHSDLNLPVGSLVVRKGNDPKIDARSVFTGSTLEESLKRYEVERLFICGVPTELTVLETSLEAVSLGFKVFVVEDEIAALTDDSKEISAALEKMKAAGVELVASTDLAT